LIDGTLLVCACSTMRTICCRVLFSPTTVASMSSMPDWLTEPPITACDVRLLTGIACAWRSGERDRLRGFESNIPRP